MNMKESKCHNTPYSAREKERALAMLKTASMEFVCHRFHCSQRSVYRWKRMYDESTQSLENKSSAPHSCPRRMSDKETGWIDAIRRRNPSIGLNELYGRLRRKHGFSRNPVTLYRYLRRKGIERPKERKKPRKPGVWDTPQDLGERMQLDVKLVPLGCGPSDGGRLYQYTIIDEATRQRYIYAYDEQCAQSTCNFVRRAIRFFGYVPKSIQTDNGQEFTYTRQTRDDKVHPFDALCERLGIEHRLIRPRTPRHNGKVERSHRSDNERFYSTMRYFSLDDLRKQMRRYLARSNDIPTSVLGWLSPNEKRVELEKLGK